MKRAGILCGFALLLVAATPAQETQHVVKEGETLNGIANRAGVGADAIIKANGLKAPYPLRTGQKLAIPRKAPARDKTGAKAKPDAPTGPEATETEHIVREGETLGGIANRAGVPKVVIAEANGLAEPHTVKAGQKLMIPRQRTHVVGKDETGFGIAYKYGVPWKAIAVANGLEQDGKVRQGQKLLIPAITKVPPPSPSQPVTTPPGATVRANGAPVFHWPLRGEVLLGFARPGMEGGHNGIDIASETGTPVKAAAGGKVVFAGDEPKTYGTMVVLEHTGGWHSAYGHLSAASVKVGQPVAAGDVVGKVGQTGLANQPALHFEIRKDNFPVDPVGRIEGSPRD